MGRYRLHRRAATAATGLVASAVLMLLRSVPSVHAPLRLWVGWVDERRVVYEQVERWGFDRYGYVHQSRLRTWVAANPAALDGVRRDHAGVVPPQLWPTQSWRLQWTSYGPSHVYFADGRSLTETGRIDALPYSLAALGCAAPAGAMVLAALARRISRARPPSSPAAG